jgi:hypothetical protein
MKLLRITSSRGRLLALLAVVALTATAALSDSRAVSADHDYFSVYDLTITGMSYTYLPAHTYPFSAGWYLIVTIKNSGYWGISTPFKVKVTSPDYNGDPEDLKFYTIGGLAKGESKGIPHKMPACTPGGYHDRLAFVDSGKAIYELNEHNNIETLSYDCP